MAGRRQYSVREFRLAIEKVGSSVRDIADELECATSTVYRYLRKYPELTDAHKAVGGEVESKPRHFEVIEKAIAGSRGNYSTIAWNAGVSRQTVHNYMRDYPALYEAAEIERGSLVDDAESAVGMLVAALDGPTVRFVLSTLGAERGWKQQSALEVSGVGLSAEVVSLLERMGKSPEMAIRQFEEMVKMTAEKAGVS